MILMEGTLLSEGSVSKTLLDMSAKIQNRNGKFKNILSLFPYALAAPVSNKPAERWLLSHKCNTTNIIENVGRQFNTATLTRKARTDRQNDILENLKKTIEILENIPGGDIFNLFVKSFGFDFTTKDGHVMSLDGEDTELGRPVWTKDLVSHIFHSSIIRLPQYMKSDILKIYLTSDGTNTSQGFVLEEMITIVANQLGADPLFIERSFEPTNSAVMYFRFTQYVPDSARSRLERFIQRTFGFTIECARKNSQSFLNLPFSAEYPEYGFYDPTSIDLPIRLATIQDIVEHIHSGYRSQVHALVRTVGPLNETTPHTFTRNTFSADISAVQKYAYGLGTRFQNQGSIAMWCANRDMTFQEYKTVMLDLDSGSKDIRRWTADGSLTHRLEKLYQWTQDHVESHSAATVGVIDAKKDPVPIMYDICDDIMLGDNSPEFDNRLRAVISQSFQAWKPGVNLTAWGPIFKKDAFELFNYIQRKLKYEQNSEKEYTSKRLAPLLSGAIVPVVVHRDLGRHLLMRTSVSKVLRFLHWSGLLTRVLIDGHDSSHKGEVFATHWVPIQSKGLYELFMSLKGMNTLSRSVSEVSKSLLCKNVAVLDRNLTIVSYINDLKRCIINIINIYRNKTSHYEEIKLNISYAGGFPFGLSKGLSPPGA